MRIFINWFEQVDVQNNPCAIIRVKWGLNLFLSPFSSISTQQRDEKNNQPVRNFPRRATFQISQISSPPIVSTFSSTIPLDIFPLSSPRIYSKFAVFAAYLSRRCKFLFSFFQHLAPVAFPFQPTPPRNHQDIKRLSSLLRRITAINPLNGIHTRPLTSHVH